MRGFTSLTAIAATALTAAPAIALTSTALPLASPGMELCPPSSVISARELTPEESAALLQSARELVAKLSAAGGDARAIQLAAELRSMGFTPAAGAGDWRQPAHALAERLQAETDPDAQRLADTLTAGVTSTLAEPPRPPASQPVEPSGVAAAAGAVAGAATPFVTTAAHRLTSDPSGSADAVPDEPEPDDAASCGSQPDDQGLPGATGNGQPGLQVCTDDPAGSEPANPGGARPELLPAADEQDSPGGDANEDGDGEGGATSGSASSSGGSTGEETPSGGSSADSETGGADRSTGDSTSTDDTSGAAADPEPADESSIGPNEDASSTGETSDVEPAEGSSGTERSDSASSEESETGSNLPEWERLAAELADRLAVSEDPEAAELADRLATLGITAADTGTGVGVSAGGERAGGNRASEPAESGTASDSAGRERAARDAESPGEDRAGAGSTDDREQAETPPRSSGGGSAAAGSGVGSWEQHAEELAALLGDDLDDPVAAALADKLAAAGIEVPGLADGGASGGASGSGRASRDGTSADSSAGAAGPVPCRRGRAGPAGSAAMSSRRLGIAAAVAGAAALLAAPRRAPPQPTPTAVGGTRRRSRWPGRSTARAIRGPRSCPPNSRA